MDIRVQVLVQEWRSGYAQKVNVAPRCASYGLVSDISLVVVGPMSIMAASREALGTLVIHPRAV